MVYAPLVQCEIVVESDFESHLYGTVVDIFSIPSLLCLDERVNPVERGMDLMEGL